MKVSYNWLKKIINFDFSAHELADRLTMLGFEVELVVPVTPSFSGVIVGKILEINKHPNADKLLLCKVSAGSENLSIVCGANNISVGDLVPLAVIGAKLTNNLVISKRSLKGIDSFGMLCSEQELGLSDKSSGIFILSEDNLNRNLPKIGSPLESAINLNDFILDISVTPNRPDALSIIGIAREIGILTKKSVSQPNANIKESGDKTKDMVAIKIKNHDLCPRYTARIISDIAIKPSPYWLRHTIQNLGIRSVNNIVDATNYILLLTGQPLHAFDYNKIAGKTIIVRTAVKGERLLCIDNEERELDKENLIIADKIKPLAVAGIIGGKDSEISEQTKNLLLESAYFNQVSIRRTSKMLGVSTESSYRFERGIDPCLPSYASDLAVELIQKISGGKASCGQLDISEDIPKPPVIRLDGEYCSRILGIDIPKKDISSMLSLTGCSVSGVSNKHLSIKPPSHRIDLKNPIDLVEEIARIYGYPKIPFNMPEAEVISPPKDNLQVVIKSLENILTALGLNQIITYSFIDPDDFNKLRIDADSILMKYPALKNPVSSQLSVMRTTLLPGALHTISHNLNNKNSSLQLFETGKCFFQDSRYNGIKENYCLSVVMTGLLHPVHWKEKEKNSDFFVLKGLLEEVFKNLYISEYKFDKTSNSLLHPGRACSIFINEDEIGFFGQLMPNIAALFDISCPVYICELDINKIIPARLYPPKYIPLPKYPEIRRDISIILDKDIPSYDIIKLINGSDVKILESVALFDQFTGQNIPDGKKSLTYAIIYRDKEKTLTDKEVDCFHNIIRQNILRGLPSAEIRE